MNVEGSEKAISPSLFYRLCWMNCMTFAPMQQHNAWKNENYQMIVILSGKGRLLLGKSGYPLERGKCFIVEPGKSIECEAGEQGLEWYILTFEVHHIGKLRSPAAESQTLPVFPCVGEVECGPFSNWLDWVEGLYSHHQSETNDELSLFDQHIRFQELLRHIFKHNLPDSMVVNSRQSVEDTIEQLNRNYGDLWTVDRMAATANLGRWQYTRLFKEITGQVPLQYLSDIRINQAKHLLQATDDRMFDIAQNIGFGNEFYFNRRFKQTVGLSPGQYRRHYREDIRVFAPFLEDFLLALGVMPALQVSYSKWGTQSYLGLDHIPAVELTTEIQTPLACKLDFVMVEYGFPEKWNSDLFEKKVPHYRMPDLGESWQETLRTVADLLGIGKSTKVVDVIDHYERKADLARKKLYTIRHQTVAFLRISAEAIILYAGPDKGYTGPILYKDLGLTPHPLVEQVTNGARRAELSLELLAQLDADHLFVTFEVSEEAKEELCATSVWKSLPAVVHNRVYEVDYLSWMNYGILSHGKKIDDVLRVLA
ncbi:AraC family transcriptional regulator [Paenibacillus sinopodophylli]|uniref:AraC family transcriptional regulator n=1 Tax=Paenibacillus sinopodophylli TaxID=1837342 RepID=UPI00110CACAC|nr:AraC family transcriptional regulator [Paenibacillus sinopodophylli]